MDDAVLRVAFVGHRTVVCGSGTQWFGEDGVWRMNSRVPLDGAYSIENDQLCIRSPRQIEPSCSRYARDSEGRIYLTYVSDVGADGPAWEVVLRPIED